MGDGGLLKAAEQRFTDIECFGIDISDEVVDNLAVRQPLWHLRQCDFRDVDALAKTRNPPYERKVISI